MPDVHMCARTPHGVGMRATGAIYGVEILYTKRVWGIPGAGVVHISCGPEIRKSPLIYANWHVTLLRPAAQNGAKVWRLRSF